MTGLDKISLLASADLTAAEVALRRIPNDDPANSLAPSVLELLRSHRAFMREIYSYGRKVGLTVFQVDTFPGGHREFVSIATYSPHSQNLKFDIESALEKIAREMQCKSMRMHTARHGLVKLSLANGWHCAEIVLRKPLP